jgi:hypothetical protein
MVRRPDIHIKGLTDNRRQAADRSLKRVAAARAVDRKIGECADTIADRHGCHASQNRGARRWLAGIVLNNDGHLAAKARDDYASAILDLHDRLL